VGWDVQEKTAIIDDVDAILAANDAEYTLMDQYLEYQRSFYEKNQRVTGNYSFGFGMGVAAAGESGRMTMDVDGKYDMLMSGATAFQFNTGMTLDAVVKENGRDISREELGAALPMDVDLELRGDLKDGNLYFQSKALSKLLMEEAGGVVTGLENMWYKLDLKALFDEMSGMTGMDYAALMELSMASMDKSFEETLAGVLRELPLVSADMTASDMLALYNAIAADSSFTKSGNSYVNTMELPGLEGFADSSMTFILPTSGGKVNGCVMEMSVELPESMGAMGLTYSFKGQKMEMSMDFDMLLADGSPEGGLKMDFSMTMEMDGTYRVTREQPAVLPPEGAVIMDLNALMPSPL